MPQARRAFGFLEFSLIYGSMLYQQLCHLSEGAPNLMAPD